MSGDTRTKNPSKVYIDNYAWLPTSKVNPRALRAALAYGDAPSEAKIIGNHVRVPRYFLPKDKLDSLGEVELEEYNFQTHNITSKTKLRDYQEEPLDSMLMSGGGILNLGCGYGKTVIALNFIARKKLKSAIILGNTSLISQWKQEIAKHLNVGEGRVGVVRGSKWQWEDHDIILISLSTLCRRAKDGRIPEGFCESFGIVIYDECHHLSAPQFSKTCPLFYGERHGLTATPKREDGLEQVFINHIGEVHYSKIEQSLIPDCYFVHTDASADARIEEDLLCRDKSTRVILDRSGEIHHRKLCSWVGTIEDRNDAILGIVYISVKAGRKTLCLTHSVEHARHLNNICSHTSGLATGEVESSERLAVIKKHAVTFATLDVAAEALDAPELSCLIVMTPFGARTQGNVLQQALGRIQRKHADKGNPIAFFMYDTKIPMMRGLCWQIRKKLYQWDYPVKEIKQNELTRENLGSLF